MESKTNNIINAVDHPTNAETLAFRENRDNIVVEGNNPGNNSQNSSAKIREENEEIKNEEIQYGKIQNKYKKKN